MRLLVSGWREWENQSIIWTALDAALADDPELVLIEGEAPGADRIAAQWAEERGLDQAEKLVRFPAHWRHNSRCPRDCTEVQGRAAGPIRNRNMLKKGKPDKVYAFSPALSKSAGTLDMVYRAVMDGVPTYWWNDRGESKRLEPREVGDWMRNRQARKGGAPSVG